MYFRFSGGCSASAAACAAAAAASMRGSGTSLPHVPQIGSEPSSLTNTGRTTIVSHPGQIAAIVSHGAAIKIFVARALGIGMAGLRAYRVASNTGVTVVERAADGAYRLLVWNDASHLGDAVADALHA